MTRRRVLPQQHAVKIRLAAARLPVVEAIDAHIRLRGLRCPIVEWIGQVGETTTDISGVSTCPFERLILLGVILNAFISYMFKRWYKLKYDACLSIHPTHFYRITKFSPEKSLSPYAKTPSSCL